MWQLFLCPVVGGFSEAKSRVCLNQCLNRKSVMNTTLTTVLYTSKTLSNGTHPLILRLTKNRRIRYISLHISLDAKFWDFDTNFPKTNCPSQQLIRLNMLKYESENNGKILVKEINEQVFAPPMIVAEQRKRIKAADFADEPIMGCMVCLFLK